MRSRHGRPPGVKIGDLFKLQYQYNYIDEQGVKYANFSDERVEFEVVKVYPDHSQLVPLNNDMPFGIQIRDVVQLDNFWN
ncbi:FlgT C-terminal domain-containing protein [Shewanella dokdonensis]|uniref:FlgT C-terminal domain-containing protein n=1 Tax=Shewanella dokdonensis TaxID=712036 RepID=UPI002467CFDA|nr:FlgT C-terminal domain-containing protein [Shewanella dokdonensis]